MFPPVPRAATTSDAFNAIAEPRRRAILELLVEDERPVTDLVERLGLPQPSVSKHLGVLHRVGLVTQRRRGRQILYRTNAVQLKAIHDWTGRFERFWTTKLDRIKERAERRTTTP